jgi:hypothetical protein
MIPKCGVAVGYVSQRVKRRFDRWEDYSQFTVMRMIYKLPLTYAFL